MDIKSLNKYIIELNDRDRQVIDHRVAEKGIENYLSQQLVYLDCTRIINNMRMMQTIGYPYQLEISSYLYVLENQVNFLTVKDSDVTKFNKEEWLNKLFERHNANLEYEKDNPPIWYGGKKAKDEWDKKHNKHPRRKNKREQTIPGLGKEVSAAQRLKNLTAQFGPLNFKLKPTKK